MSDELYDFIGLAVQERLRDILDNLSTISKQRLDQYKVVNFYYDHSAASSHPMIALSLFLLD